MSKITISLFILLLPLLGQDITNKLGSTTESATYDVTDSADNVLFRVEGNGEIGIGTDTPEANLDVHGTVGLFDNYVSKSTHSVYNADTDGFVVAYATVTSPGSEIEGLVGPQSSGGITNPPSTLIIKSRHDEGIINFTMPVRKGLAWSVDASGTFSSINVYWIELGQ